MMRVDQTANPVQWSSFTDPEDIKPSGLSAGKTASDWPAVPAATPARVNSPVPGTVSSAEVYDYAQLADAVYEQGNVAGWTRLDASALGTATTAADTGFLAGVYRSDANGQVVVAFAGTDFGDIRWNGDWATNIGQATGSIPPQYAQALKLANAAKQQFGANVTLVGHSLGGGLASFAGLGAGLRTCTFNAAGLGLGARGFLWRTGALDAHRHLITNINVRGEILTSDPWLRLPGVTPEQIGAVHEIEPPGTAARGGTASSLIPSRVTNHGMQAILRALEAGNSPKPTTTEVGPGFNPPGKGEAVSFAAEILERQGAKAGFAHKLLGTVGKTVSFVSNLMAVNELVDGDAKVKQFAAEGRRRDAVRQMGQTTGAFIAAVLSTPIRVFGAGYAITEAGRFAGDRIAGGINSLFGVRDVAPRPSQQ